MTKFLVTHTLDHTELADHINKVGTLQNVTISAIAERPSQLAPKAPKLVPGPKTNGGGRGRKPGGSTVNSAVLSAMASGPTSTAALKDALTAAGKKPSSLPTALAALQKSGEIERVGAGQYQLSAEAALAAE
jgi:hypothetical protein